MEKGEAPTFQVLPLVGIPVFEKNGQSASFLKRHGILRNKVAIIPLTYKTASFILDKRKVVAKVILVISDINNDDVFVDRMVLSDTFFPRRGLS
jgi:hypothetical protein